MIIRINYIFNSRPAHQLYFYKARVVRIIVSLINVFVVLPLRSKDAQRLLSVTYVLASSRQLSPPRSIGK